MTEQQPKPQDLDETPAKPKRRWTRTLLWVAGPALVVGIGAWLYVTAGRYASTDNAYIQADHVTVAPQIGGRVVEVDVRENQVVKKGDVLFRIDAEPLEIAYARMQAQVDSVKSLLNAARSGYTSAQADQRSSAADLKYKQQQFARMQELRGRGSDRTSCARQRGERSRRRAREAGHEWRRRVQGAEHARRPAEHAGRTTGRLQARARAVRAGQARSRPRDRARADGRRGRQDEFAARATSSESVRRQCR